MVIVMAQSFGWDLDKYSEICTSAGVIMNNISACIALVKLSLELVANVESKNIIRMQWLSAII